MKNPWDKGNQDSPAKSISDDSTNTIEAIRDAMNELLDTPKSSDSESLLEFEEASLPDNTDSPGEESFNVHLDDSSKNSDGSDNTIDEIMSTMEGLGAPVEHRESSATVDDIRNTMEQLSKQVTSGNQGDADLEDGDSDEVDSQDTVKDETDSDDADSEDADSQDTVKEETDSDDTESKGTDSDETQDEIPTNQREKNKETEKKELDAIKNLLPTISTKEVSNERKQLEAIRGLLPTSRKLERDDSERNDGGFFLELADSGHEDNVSVVTIQTDLNELDRSRRSMLGELDRSRSRPTSLHIRESMRTLESLAEDDDSVQSLIGEDKDDTPIPETIIEESVQSESSGSDAKNDKEGSDSNKAEALDSEGLGGEHSATDPDLNDVKPPSSKKVVFDLDVNVDSGSEGKDDTEPSQPDSDGSGSELLSFTSDQVTFDSEAGRSAASSLSSFKGPLSNIHQESETKGGSAMGRLFKSAQAQSDSKASTSTSENDYHGQSRDKKRQRKPRPIRKPPSRKPPRRMPPRRMPPRRKPPMKTRGGYRMNEYSYRDKKHRDYDYRDHGHRDHGHRDHGHRDHGHRDRDYRNDGNRDYDYGDHDYSDRSSRRKRIRVWESDSDRDVLQSGYRKLQPEQEPARPSQYRFRSNKVDDYQKPYKPYSMKYDDDDTAATGSSTSWNKSYYDDYGYSSASSRRDRTFYKDLVGPPSLKRNFTICFIFGIALTLIFDIALMMTLLIRHYNKADVNDDNNNRRTLMVATVPTNICLESVSGGEFNTTCTSPILPSEIPLIGDSINSKPFDTADCNTNKNLGGGVGNLVAQALLNQTKLMAELVDVDAAVIHAGMVHSDIPAGDFLTSSVHDILHLHEERRNSERERQLMNLVVLDLTGAQLQRTLERAIGRAFLGGVDIPHPSAYPYTAGLRFSLSDCYNSSNDNINDDDGDDSRKIPSTSKSTRKRISVRLEVAGVSAKPQHARRFLRRHAEDLRPVKRSIKYGNADRLVVQDVFNHKNKNNNNNNTPLKESFEQTSTRIYHWVPLNPERIYRVVTTQYLADGGEGYDFSDAINSSSDESEPFSLKREPLSLERTAHDAFLDYARLARTLEVPDYFS